MIAKGVAELCVFYLCRNGEISSRCTSQPCFFMSNLFSTTPFCLMSFYYFFAPHIFLINLFWSNFFHKIYLYCCFSPTHSINQSLICHWPSFIFVTTAFTCRSWMSSFVTSFCASKKKYTTDKLMVWLPHNGHDEMCPLHWRSEGRFELHSMCCVRQLRYYKEDERVWQRNRSSPSRSNKPPLFLLLTSFSHFSLSFLLSPCHFSSRLIIPVFLTLCLMPLSSSFLSSLIMQRALCFRQ